MPSRRMMRRLRGLDLWLLVADSKGVNVWCAAGAEEFNTHSVVSAVKTSAIAARVDHRRLTLPPLGAPGIRARDVEEQTGWSVRWGPVRERDIPRYIGEGERRDEEMKRARYDWRERLDTGLGGLSSTMASDFDAFLGRLGVGAVGNVAFAGTIRTELLNGFRVLTYHPENCVACLCWRLFKKFQMQGRQNPEE